MDILLHAWNQADPRDQRENFSYVDPRVAAYISGLVEDEDEEADDIVEMTRGMLDDASLVDEPTKLDDLCVPRRVLGNIAR